MSAPGWGAKPPPAERRWRPKPKMSPMSSNPPPPPRDVRRAPSGPKEKLSKLVSPAGAAPRAAAAEAGNFRRARLALRVNLAAIELAPFLLVGENLVRRVQLGEAVLGLGIGRIGIRVELLRELAIGALDLCLVGGLGNTEDVVGITHE